MPTTDPAALAKHQPKPKPSTGDVWRLVIEDMEERRRVGIERYGTPLQPHNGRDALVDLYQELLDACVYARQAIAERKAQQAEASAILAQLDADQYTPPMGRIRALLERVAGVRP